VADGFSPKEAAAIAGLPESAVRAAIMVNTLIEVWGAGDFAVRRVP
jgi:hypothetical protein